VRRSGLGPSVALLDEVAGFFDDFVDAFSSFSGARIATRYAVPGVALRGDGSIQCLQSRVEVERFFQAAVDTYHREGCRGPRRRADRRTKRVGTVTWELLREDGSVLRQWRQSYNLVPGRDGMADP